MSPVVSIELLLDPALDAQVREDWRRLAAAGHSSMGAHPSPSNRPHITLLVREHLAEIDASEAVAMLAIDVELGPATVFARRNRGVLIRPVTPTPALAALHRGIHHAAGPGADAPHTAPGQWTPHVTLARRLRLAELDAARAVLAPPLAGEATGLRRWDAATRTVTFLGGR